MNLSLTRSEWWRRARQLEADKGRIDPLMGELEVMSREELALLAVRLHELLTESGTLLGQGGGKGGAAT